MVGKVDKKKKTFLINCFFISIGSALFAFALQYFVIPSQFTEGGLAGVALLLKYSLNIAPWLTMLVVNILLLFAVWKWTGLDSALYTLIGGGSFSLFLWLAEFSYNHLWALPIEINDDLLIAIIAGLTSGVGVGIVLRFGGSTGGTTLIAMLFRHFFGWREGRVILYFDILVIGISVFIIPMDKILYTLIMVFISARAIDFVIQDAYSAKGITVFSRNPALLAERIQNETQRGLTLFQAKGGYSGENIEVVYCVVSRTEVHHFKRIVKQVDPEAFFIVQDVKEVLWEGVKNH